MESLMTSKIMLVVLKLVIAGFFAYTTGSLFDATHVTALFIAAVTGLLGVKSFEFMISMIGN